ncbi:MAG TPA: hypothetical protein PLM53_19670 [Spirochaetota bacterium]|nr:hypothetical protein [Spirochaetota bacterium]HPC43215.1 hypothetical protein [Spirochaetota bacterium]HPL18977.1 hypothetical protein [Spirochaetota bacterium]HQF10414.1 hypothetical protein [Spirochaetota bacterium]HQH99313.1 hypothetical protein [Spirochaetota bacterium]
MRSAWTLCVVTGLLLAVLVPGALPAAAEKPAPSSSDGPAPPKDPSSPSVELRDPRDAGRKSDVPATIVTARGDRKTGTLTMKFGSMEVSAEEGGAHRKISIAIAEIDSIEFTRWRGVERRKNEFAFYPAKMKITLLDKRVLMCNGGVSLLHRLPFRDGGGSRFIYAYFYDYWKNGAWKNSGRSDRSYPETTAPGDTVVKIIFLKEEMKNPLEKLLSR